MAEQSLPLSNQPQQKCVIPGCNKTGRSRRLCSTHYTQIAKAGELDQYPKIQSVEKWPEHNSYVGARSRCTKPTNENYKNYGGRGIEFRFTSFEHFLNHIGFKPSPLHTLDRINVDGHYEPGNVRWATQIEQNRNRRNTPYITIDGETLSWKDWTDRKGFKPNVIYARIRRFGWCERCAVTIPIGGQPCPHRQLNASDRLKGDEWKRLCYLLHRQFRAVHNINQCNEPCEPCDIFCEISGELADWIPEEEAALDKAGKG